MLSMTVLPWIGGAQRKPGDSLKLNLLKVESETFQGGRMVGVAAWRLHA